MSKEYLIAVDMEGVHDVMGEPYNVSVRPIGVDTKQYATAVASATKEVNVAINALFESGAEKVFVWDNHAGGGNLDFSKIDARAQQLIPDNTKLRMTFLSEYNFAGIVFIGYHSRAGSINGVLAHTYNGIDIQYMKINGKFVGEFNIDSYIAGEYAVPPIFAASDDVCIGQVLEHSPDTVTSLTKIGKGRRKAVFFDESEVLSAIDKGVREAVSKKIAPTKLTFPCEYEIRYSSMDTAEWILESRIEQVPSLRYGEDAHTLRATFQGIDELRYFL